MRPPTQRQLEAGMEQTELRDTLSHLDQTLAQFTTAVNQITTSTKLDQALVGLVGQYGGDRAKVGWEYGKIQQQMAQAEAAAHHTRMQRIVQDSTDNLFRQQAIQDQLSMYAQQDSDAPLDEMSMVRDASAAGQMRMANMAYMQRNYHAASRAGYFGDMVQDPYFRSIGSRDGRMTPSQYLKAERTYMEDLAESESPRRMRGFMHHQRDVHHEVQQAMLNEQLSSNLGVRGGISYKGDFQSMTLPAVSGFAEDIGTSLDEAALVIRKLRDIRAITQDLSSGKGMEVVSAVDHAALIFERLGNFLGTTDVATIMSSAQKFTAIGHGSFERGFGAVVGGDRGAGGIHSRIIGPFGDPSYGIHAAAQASAQYGQLYGQDSMAGLQAGAWDHRVRNLMAQHATGDHFGYMGDPAKAADIYAPFLAARGTGMQAMLRHAGGGHDIMAGAAAMAGDASRDAVGFYSGMARRGAEAARDQTGAGVEMNLRREIRMYQTEFGLSEQEALLAVFGGNAVAADAYREVQSAQDRYATQFEQFLQAGRFSRIMDVGDRGGFVARQPADFTDLDRVRTGVATSVAGQLWQDLTVNPFMTARDALVGIVPEWESYRENVYTDMAERVQVRTIDRTIDRGFADRLRKDRSSLLMHIPEMLDTDEAAAEIKSVTEKVVRRRGRFDFNDVRRILAAGMRGMASRGVLSEELREELSEYIANLQPRQAFDEIGPLVTPGSAFHRLLQIAIDPDKISTLASTREQAMHINIAGSLLEAGMSAQELEELMPAEQMWAGRWAGRIEDFEHVLNAGAVAVTAGTMLATGGVGGIIAAPLAVGSKLLYSSMAAPVAKAGLEAIEGVSGWADTVLGDGLGARDTFMRALSAGDAGGYEQELRALLMLTRGMMETQLSFNLAERVIQYLSRLFNIYARSYNDIKKDRRRGESLDYHDPMSPGELNAVAATALEGMRSFADDFPNLERWINIVLGTLNSARSQVGASIREAPNPLTAVADVLKDLRDQSGEVRLGTVTGAVSGATQFLANVADRFDDGRELAELIPAITAGVEDTRAVVEHFGNIEQMIGTRARSTEELEASNRLLDTLRTAVDTGDYSGITRLSARDIDAASRTLGADFTDRLKQLTGETDPDIIRRELIPMMAQIGQQAEQDIQTVSANAQKNIELFAQMADIMLFNPDAKRKVVQLGQLLRGEAVTGL